MIDVVEPFVREIVELGYDRSIPAWEPTPARLIPPLNPEKVAADLVDAIGEGINNAAALVSSAPLHLPSAPVTAGRNAAVQQEFSEPTITVEGIGRDVTDGVAQAPNGVESLLPKHPAVTRDGLAASQSTVGRVLPETRDQIRQSIGAVKSVFGNGRTSVHAAGGDSGFTVGSAGPARKTPVRDVVSKAGSDLKKAVNTASRDLKKTLSGGSGDNNHGDNNHTEDRGQGGAQ